MKASFVLAADPGRRLPGTVMSVAMATQVKSGGGQSVLVRIRLDEPQKIDIRQVGTEVSVKIYYAEGTLGQSIFRDLGEFIQSNILFHFR